MQTTAAQVQNYSFSDSSLTKLHTLAKLIKAEDQRAVPYWNQIAPSAHERLGVGLRYYLFWQALGHRIVANDALKHEHNLYLSSFKVPQIELFNLMGTRMPLVTLASTMSNEMLARQIAADSDVTLMDVGIGTGRQEVALLHLLHAQGRRPRRLRIIGIEPSAEALRIARREIDATAQMLGLNVIFEEHVGLIEDFSLAQWASFKREGSFLINGAFALHHLGYADRPSSDARMSDDAKQDVLRRLRQLNPDLLVLAEPDSDHATSSLTERLRNAWHHFGLVFSVIDRADIPEDAQNAMKAFFFGREIDDIIAGPAKTRSERHECAAQWFNRLYKAGFRGNLPALTVQSTSPAVQIERFKDTHYTLNHADKSVLALFAVSS